MEAFTEEYGLQVFDDEPMVMGRNSKSVSFMEPTLSFPAYHLAPLVPSFMDSKTSSKKSEMHTSSMDPFLVSVSTLSEVHIDSITTDDAVKQKLASFHYSIWSISLDKAISSQMFLIPSFLFDDRT